MTAVRRKFGSEYGFNGRYKKLRKTQFSRVNDRFLKHGIRGPPKPEKVEDKFSERNLKVMEHFVADPNSSLNLASKEIHIPRATIHKVLSKVFKWHPYKSARGQELSERHKQDFLSICSKTKIGKITKKWKLRNNLSYHEPF